MIREENRLYYTLLYKPCWVQGLMSMSRELQGREAEIFLKLNHEVANACMSISTGKYVLKDVPFSMQAIHHLQHTFDKSKCM